MLNVMQICDLFHTQISNYIPPTEGEWGHTAFGADRVGIGVASCLQSIF